MPPYNMDNAYSDNHSSHSCCNDSSPSKQQQQQQPLHHTTSNVGTHNELLQLAAIELESMRGNNSNNSSPSPPHRNNNNSTRRCPPRKQGSSGSLSSVNSNNSSSGSSEEGEGTNEEEMERAFPPACLHLLHTLPNNTKCHDCSAPHPSWASVSYGITLCLQCSGKHRSLGVNVSYVKSITLDSWKRKEILCMLEGGNGQLMQFFDRHGMGSSSSSQQQHQQHQQQLLLQGSPTTSGASSPRGNVGVLDRYKTKAASFYRQHLKSHAKQVAAKGGLYEGREASRKGSSSGSSSTSSSSQSTKKMSASPKSRRKKSGKTEVVTMKKLETVTER